MSAVYSVILAGGAGSRFWPLSRQSNPKQFLSISDNGESLIQATARRVEPLVGKDNCIVVTNVLHESQVREHVPLAEVICEPVLRNTAASIGLAALHVQAKSDDGVFVVLPADHAVTQEENLCETLRRAVELASQGERLVTVGIKPTSPNVGYGYIRTGNALEGGFEVSEFCEKPNLEKAIEYVNSGVYYWNSGMFAWKASSYLSAVKKYMPELFAGLEKIKPVVGKENELEVTAEVFDSLSSVSVDYGIMEHADNCLMVEAVPYGWNDVGAWDAWAEHFDADDQKNVCTGDVVVLDSQDCVVNSNGRTVALLGVSNLVVIETADAVLVCDKEKAQEVKKIVQKLESDGRDELL